MEKVTIKGVEFEVVFEDNQWTAINLEDDLYFAGDTKDSVIKQAEEFFNEVGFEGE